MFECVGKKTHPSWSPESKGSVNKKRTGKFDEVESWRQLTSLAVKVGLHVWQAVVCLLLGQILKTTRWQLGLHLHFYITAALSEQVNTSDLVELFFGDIGLVLSAEGPEGALDLLTGFYVFCLTADHEGHVLL